MTASPFTLRDVQRLVARNTSRKRYGFVSSSQARALRALGLAISSSPRAGVVTTAPHPPRCWYPSDLDRLISLHGPGALARDVLLPLPPDPPDDRPVAGECPASPSEDGDGAHCSDCDEADPPPQTSAGQADQSAHTGAEESAPAGAEGGDNDPDLTSPSRTERDSAAPADASAAPGGGGAGNQRVGDTSDPAAAGSEAEDVRAEPSADDGCPQGSCAPAKAGASEEGEPSESEVTPGGDGDGDPDDIPAPVGAEDGARSDRAPAGTTIDATPEAPEGGPVTSGVPDDLSELGQASDPFSSGPPGPGEGCERIPVWTPGYHPGTDHLVEDYVASLRGRAARDARVCAREIRRLLADTPGVGLDPSPRIDHRRLIGELVTRRYALSRAQRRELAPGLVLLLADVSGSCSAVCSSTVAAARALAAELDDVLVLEHSNGIVERASGQAAPRAAAAMRDRPSDGHTYEPRISAVVDALSDPVRAAIAWGDTDASDDYRRLVEGGTVLWWLDSYRCSELSRPEPFGERARAAICQGWRRQPAAMWAGVNSARRTAQVLRQIRRDGRR